MKFNLAVLAVLAATLSGAPAIVSADTLTGSAAAPASPLLTADNGVHHRHHRHSRHRRHFGMSAAAGV